MHGLTSATVSSRRLALLLVIKYLAAHYNGDWELAMAAYNTGAANVDRAISRAGTANFWTIYPYIDQETRNYVPNILAVILIAKNPEKYGFKGIKPDAPWRMTSFSVGRDQFATRRGCDRQRVDHIRSLNPELKRDITPRGEFYDLRVPAGRSKQLAAILKRIAPDRRETARVISVAPGEELQSVANRTGSPSLNCKR